MAGVNVRDRIVEMRRVASSELIGNDANFRVHPSAQKNAFSAVLDEVGIAGALIAYHSERNGGALTLIDGHMRSQEFAGDWPVLVTDLNDDEADKLLLAYDPVSHMAINDKRMLDELRDRANFQDASIQVMLDELQNLTGSDGVKMKGQASGEKDDDKGGMIQEMEVMPYEHYDFIMVLCKTTFDWNFLSDRFDLVKANCTNDQRITKVGLGRCISGDRVISLIKSYEDQVAAVRQFIADCDSLTDEDRSAAMQSMERAISGEGQY